MMALETYHLNRWMQDLPMTLQTCPLIYLAIPGSHNTFSYSISKRSKVSPDSPNLVRYLSRIAKPIVNPFIYKWSKTQSFDILTQLNNGIRYLDIRVVSGNGVPFVCHGLFGGLLIPYLEQILLFLENNQGEVIILDFQHFYNFALDNHNNLISNLIRIFRDRMCDVTNINTLTILNLIQNGKKVLVVYRSNIEFPYPFLWPSGALPTPWPNKLKISDLEDFLDWTLKHRNNNVGIVTQFLLTVDTKYVIKNPCLSLKAMASETNSQIITWLNTHNTGAAAFNVIICDFVQDNDFSKCVVELNYKRDFTK